MPGVDCRGGDPCSTPGNWNVPLRALVEADLSSGVRPPLPKVPTAWVVGRAPGGAVRVPLTAG